MLRTVQGIILRTVKYSETSIICDAYTLELGLRTYIISGVRKKNAKVSPGLVRPMSLVEMVVYHQEEKEINRIKEIKPSYIFQEIPFDIAKGTIGLFITEIAQKSIKEASENPPLFHFLTDIYQVLDSTKDKVANFPAWFLVQFSFHMGLAPMFESLAENAHFDYAEGKVVNNPPEHIYYFEPNNTLLMAGLQKLNHQEAASLTLSIQDRRNFIDCMLKYYRYHIENFGECKSLVVLQEVFS